MGTDLKLAFLVSYSILFAICDCQLTSEKGKLIDLTHVFDETTIYPSDQDGLNVIVLHNGTFANNEYWYHDEKFSAPTHGGTHMDAPCMFDFNNWCIPDIPVERLILPAVVIDISDKVKDNPDEHLEVEDILKWEELHGLIPFGSLVLVHTGWSRFWHDYSKYTGDWNSKATTFKFPSISKGAAEYIIHNKNVYGIGIDSFSLNIPVFKTDAHVILLKNNIYGLENVYNLDKLPPTGATAIVMPMKLGGASGAPCRIMAQLP